jgi:hypothetical protein
MYSAEQRDAAVVIAADLRRDRAANRGGTGQASQHR